MKTWAQLLMSVGLLVTLTTGWASAQYPLPPSRANMPPVLSPWLSMNNAGLPPALNYFNLVRPQFEFRNAVGQLQAQTTADQQAISNLGQAALPATGHKVGFQTQGRYFMTIRGFGGMTPGMQGGQLAGRRQQRPTPTSGMSGGMGMPSMPSTPYGR